MNTDVDIIVINLLWKISAACSLISVLERYDCVRSQRQAQASVDLPNEGLGSPLYADEFMDKA